MNRILVLFSAVAAFWVATVAPAIAAPQILAVMASLGPQSMHCSGALCTTTLSSYCLQKERDLPVTGQRYLPASKDQFQLVVVRADGSETTVPAGDHMTFRSVRGYSSVNAVISKQALADLGGVSARIIVAERAALVPEAVAGDPNPISEQELAYAARSLRDHGNDMVDAKPDAEAASVINRIAATIVPGDSYSDQGMEQLWHDVIDGMGSIRPVGTEGIRRARDIYDWCQGRTSYYSMAGVKSCLEFKHDSTIMKLNGDYWDSQPGF
ncbi:MAG: hypothetical protein WD075_14400 [Rhodospirillales bacterium]